MTHYALAHPDKHFELHSATHALLVAPPVNKPAERIYQIFGNDTLQQLIPLAAELRMERTGIPSPQWIEVRRQANRLPDLRGICVRGRDAGTLNHIYIRNSFVHDVTGVVNWIGGDVADNQPPWVTFQTGWDDSKRTGGIIVAMLGIVVWCVCAWLGSEEGPTPLPPAGH